MGQSAILMVFEKNAIGVKCCVFENVQSQFSTVILMSFFSFFYGLDRRVGLSRRAVPTCGG